MFGTSAKWVQWRGPHTARGVHDEAVNLSFQRFLSLQTATSVRAALARIKASVKTASGATHAPARRDSKAKTVSSVSATAWWTSGSQSRGDTEGPERQLESFVVLGHAKPPELSLSVSLKCCVRESECSVGRSC